jgi:uncharacterized protein with ParB-like and HNH nuclease domain
MENILDTVQKENKGNSKMLFEKTVGETDQALLSISELILRNFIVAKYQRGYKWNIEQVRQLLEDIENFSNDKDASFYCLQPIILTASEKYSNFWEVIDGQQRLTTIYLILKALKIEPFELKYQTRTRSEKFLTAIEEELDEDLSVDLKNDKKAEKDLTKKWEEYIQNNSTYNNIDNYHFFKAFYYIKNWLGERYESLNSFKNTFKEKVKVIWYVLEGESSDAETIFINFNKGKIELDQADLIKAEFILRLNKEIHNKEIRELKAQEFALEWNGIENFLQNDEFWYFLSNKSSGKQTYNRIDLLFDLIKEKKNNKDRLYSYFKFHESGFKDEDWQEVKNLFEILKEWFLNRTSYHLIGFVLTHDVSDLQKLRKIYRDAEDKQSFLNKLRKLIRTKYENEEGVFSLDNVFYPDKECNELLLLFNIGIEEKGDVAYRFPFYKQKQQTWNLEHIHAQKTDAFKLVNEVFDWLEDMESLAAHFRADGANKEENFPVEKIQKLRESLNKSEQQKLSSFQKDLISHLNEIFKNYFDTDHISNLCLLDDSTNKAIGNDPFYKKRIDVLSIAEKGKKGDKKVYVPTGTTRVFSKFYHFDKTELQMTYWGGQERRRYIAVMIETINEFLKEQ